MIKKKELVLNSVAEFLGIWAASGEASLSLSTKDGVTTIAFSHTLSGHPDDPLLPPPAPTVCELLATKLHKLVLTSTPTGLNLTV